MESVPLYLDHASTSWPKSPGVAEAVALALETASSPGRGVHQLAEAGEAIVERARSSIAKLIRFASPERVLLLPSATHALNLAIKGLGLDRGDHVVATCFDHNSALRPLDQLRRSRGVRITTVRSKRTDKEFVEAVRTSLRPQTRLLTFNHASNVSGEILPAADLIEIAHAAGVPVLLDASQTVGHIELRHRELPADLIAFGSHKALLGPPGVGCLIAATDDLDLSPDTVGGTGLDSQSLAPETVYPSSFEAGTPNVPAIAGLTAALDAQSQREKLSEELARLRVEAVEGLKALPKVTVHSRSDQAVPIVSFNVEGMSPRRASERLDQDHGIQTRPGLHCAPLAHEALGTAPIGTVRASFGFGNRPDAAARLVEAVAELTRSAST